MSQNVMPVFALDPDVFNKSISDQWKSMGDERRRLIVNAHSALLSILNERGVLAIADSGGNEQRSLIENLPQAVKQYWQKCTRDMRKLPIENWAGVNVCIGTRCMECAASQVDSVIVDDVNAAAFGIASEDNFYTKTYVKDDVSKKAIHVEFCRFSASERSAYAQFLRHAFIEIGAKRDDVWCIFFKLCAAFANQVVLIDKFASEVGNHAAVEYIVEKLNTDVYMLSDPRKLTIYCDGSDHDNINKLFHKLKKIKGQMGRKWRICSVVLYGVPGKKMSDMSHFRYVRFGHVVCELDRPTDLLNKMDVEHKASLAVYQKSEDHSHHEAELCQCKIERFEV